MPVARRAKAQRPLEENLARRAGEKIGSTHDFRDALPLVVHDNGQMVSSGPVTALHDEVAGLDAAVLLTSALERVVELYRRLERVDGESKRMRPAGGRRPLAAGSWIDRFGWPDQRPGRQPMSLGCSGMDNKVLHPAAMRAHVGSHRFDQTGNKCFHPIRIQT